VVLCQPLGIEAICVYFTYRALADRLAELGLAVLRFDYDGTGDSAGGETDPDRVTAWLDSVTEATAFLSGTGVTSVGLVGIRIGGLFAAHEAARRGGVEALVLWDPCLSGTAFLREQRFLQLLGAGPADDDGEAVEAPGIRFEPETVKELSDLELGRLQGPLADRVLALVPPGRSRPRALARRLEHEAAEWGEATGQEQLLDSQRQDPPTATIERVAAWLAAALPGDPVTIGVPASGVGEVGRTGDGGAVVERAVQLGPVGLFGLVTEGPGHNRGPTVVLVNEGNTHHIGQARIWVDLARKLGSRGFRVLRFDLSGNGDSGTRPGQEAHVARAPEAGDDVLEAVRAMSPVDPSDVVLIGFCSGAYQIAELALDHHFLGICVINPFFSFVPPEPPGTHRRPAQQSTRRGFVRLARGVVARTAHRRDPTETERWLTALDTGTWPVAVAKRRPLPQPVWRLVNRFLMINPGIGTLEQIVAGDVDTLLVCGPDDLLPISLGAEDRVQRLRDTGLFHIEMLDDLDHASWGMAQRRRMIDVLADYLDDRHGGRPSGSGPTVGR
jgi:alpha-beta hydrolase superfamily lysophospholipase